MSSALDMSLDEIIKSNKKPNSSAPSSRGRGGRRSAAGPGPGPGPSRRFPNRSAGRSAPYSKPVQAPDLAWDHDMFPGQAAVAYPAPGVASAGQRGGGSIETGTKLYISNLDYGVSNEDIKELFAEVGDLKRYGIHYDRSGRSKGTADVVFSRREEALAAVKRYNNVMLDGKPMKIEIVGTNILTPAVVAPAITDATFRNQNGPFRSGGQGRGGAAWHGRGGGPGARMGRGRGRGGGRGRGRGENMSAEDLDADLDKYHSESMHTD